MNEPARTLLKNITKRTDMQCKELAEVRYLFDFSLTDLRYPYPNCINISPNPTQVSDNLMTLGMKTVLEQHGGHTMLDDVLNEVRSSVSVLPMCLIHA